MLFVILRRTPSKIVDPKLDCFLKGLPKAIDLQGKSRKLPPYSPSSCYSSVKHGLI